MSSVRGLERQVAAAAVGPDEVCPNCGMAEDLGLLSSDLSKRHCPRCSYTWVRPEPRPRIDTTSPEAVERITAAVVKAIDEMSGNVVRLPDDELLLFACPNCDATSAIASAMAPDDTDHLWACKCCNTSSREGLWVCRPNPCDMLRIELVDA